MRSRFFHASFLALGVAALGLLAAGFAYVQEHAKGDETPDESGLVSAFISRVDVAPIRGSRLVNVSFTRLFVGVTLAVVDVAV